MEVRLESENTIAIGPKSPAIALYAHIRFQNGTVAEVGENGCQVEDVLEAALLRLQQLNERFPCRENALAITNAQQAVFWLRERTRVRQAQGVEGQYEPHQSTVAGVASSGVNAAGVKTPAAAPP